MLQLSSRYSPRKDLKANNNLKANLKARNNQSLQRVGVRPTSSPSKKSVEGFVKLLEKAGKMTAEEFHEKLNKGMVVFIQVFRKEQSKAGKGVDPKTQIPSVQISLETSQMIQKTLDWSSKKTPILRLLRFLVS